MDKCKHYDNLPEGKTVCSFGRGCLACQDCVCPDCHLCKDEHCSCNNCVTCGKYLEEDEKYYCEDCDDLFCEKHYENKECC